MAVQVYGVPECRDICRDGFGGPDGMAVHCNDEHRRDMELASIHARVSERLGINMQENMLKYLLPIDGHIEQVLHDDGDVQAMFDLHKCQGTSFINLHIHAVDSRCLSTYASRRSEVLQTRMSLLWKPQNRLTYREAVWNCTTTEQKERKNVSVRLTVWCNVDVFPSCLHASVIREGPEFAIKSLNNIHSCGCDIMSDRHPRTSKKWVANAVKGKLVDKPTYRASEMIRDIRRDYGIFIPYHQRIAYVVIEQEYQDAMIAMELNSVDAKEWVLRNDVDH
ncbi:hypothetical protein Taro_055622 [Colocasia esculenta]|uniref:Uncharacterized protein n=1 Tax=Colocasia esculenta TaxID=4460 RepID=A0A843XRG7_COLES|nr:hypothetical protein [Colocasia esculenta]